VTVKDLDFSFADGAVANALAAGAATPQAAVGGAKSKVRPAAAPKETFYFYQSSDGQPIFLHAMNVEMLIAEHGSFESCPKKIRGKILERDSASMTLDLRNKLRYLSHVPVTCAFEVVEIELSGSLSKEVRSKFSGQVEARRARRQKRARDERRRERKIKVAENKIMGKYTGPRRNLHLESEVHFPGFPGNSTLDQEDDHDQGQQARRVSESSGFSAAEDYPAIQQPQQLQQPSSAATAAGGSSFAKMLSKPGAARTAAAAQPRLVRSETFPLPVFTALRPRNSGGGGSDSETEGGMPEGYVPPPPSQSIGDALASALACVVDVGASGPPPSSGGKKRGKKVKGKKIDLFSSARPTL